MIEVQVRVDDDPDVLRPNAKLRESILEQRASVRAGVLDAVDVVELRRLLVARARIDDDDVGFVLDHQASHAELNAVALVGRNAPFPERLRNDTEHRATIELLATGLNRVNAQLADGQRLDEWGERGRHATSGSGLVRPSCRDR